jgi:hypothetical protein
VRFDGGFCEVLAVRSIPLAVFVKFWRSAAGGEIFCILAQFFRSWEIVAEQGGLSTARVWGRAGNCPFDVAGV